MRPAAVLRDTLVGQQALDHAVHNMDGVVRLLLIVGLDVSQRMGLATPLHPQLVAVLLLLHLQQHQRQQETQTLMSAAPAIRIRFAAQAAAPNMVIAELRRTTAEADASHCSELAIIQIPVMTEPAERSTVVKSAVPVGAAVLRDIAEPVQNTALPRIARWAMGRVMLI